jgi:cytochrome b6-f complex iron-sulfur subunit
MNAPKTTRRKFCGHAVSMVALASLAESCGGSPTSSGGGGGSTFPALTVLNGTSANNAVTLTIDASSPLATVGNAALVQASAGNFLVARTAQDALTALTAVCTHQGCTITNYQSQTYGCPCHGSEFSTTGAVRNGPAATALRQFSTQFVNNVLTISLV